MLRGTMLAAQPAAAVEGDAQVAALARHAVRPPERPAERCARPRGDQNSACTSTMDQEYLPPRGQELLPDVDTGEAVLVQMEAAAGGTPRAAATRTQPPPARGSRASKEPPATGQQARGRARRTAFDFANALSEAGEGASDDEEADDRTVPPGDAHAPRPLDRSHRVTVAGDPA